MPAVFSSLSIFTTAVVFCIIATVLSFAAPHHSFKFPSNIRKFKGTATPPAVIDWRARGVVGEVQNQGQSGDAALFATIGNIASVSAITNGMNYIPLSINELLTCGPNGQDGTFVDAYYRWIGKEAQGIVAKAVPGTNVSCSNLAALPTGAKVTGIKGIISSEAEIHQALQDGPVFVAIDADPLVTYTGGVLSQCPANTIDDAALIVGVNTTATPPYWTLQMSWGKDFGENGYVQVEYGKNLCGINSFPITVTTAKLQ